MEIRKNHKKGGFIAKSGENYREMRHNTQNCFGKGLDYFVEHRNIMKIRNVVFLVYLIGGIIYLKAKYG